MGIKNGLQRLNRLAGLNLLTLTLTLMLMIPMSWSNQQERQWTLQFETLIQAFERPTADGLSLPFYEFVNIDYSQSEMAGLGFHLYGWGRMAVSGEDNFQDNPDGDLVYGYLSYQDPQQGWMAQLGRIEMFSRFAREGFDGLRLTLPILSLVDVELYGGAPFNADDDNLETGDLLYGANITHRSDGFYHLSAGYKRVTYDATDDEELLQFDLSWQPLESLYFMGRSTFNLASRGWAEHAYQMTFLMGNLTLEPYYQRFQFEDLFGEEERTPTPFRAFATGDDVLDVVGGKVDWRFGTKLSTGVTIEQYSRKKNDLSALSSQLRLLWQPNIKLQVGTDLGLMNGDTNRTRYQSGRIYFYLEPVPVYRFNLFFSGDLMLAKYDEDFYGEDQSFDVTGSIGSKFLNDSLALKLAVEYSENPYFLDDFRGTLILVYRLGS